MERKHRLLNVDGVRIHAVEAGQGPLVLLVHGFPESWYSWRHQLQALAEAGYRAVAIDQRGYGRSSKFGKQEAYRIHPLVADAVGTIKALGESEAIIVGHDWGAVVAWTAAWLHPEPFRGVVGMSVPFAGRALIGLPGSPFGERRPDDLHRELAAPGTDFYQTYFGAQDGIVDEIEADLRGWLRGMIYGCSGDALSQVPVPDTPKGPVERIRNGPFCIPHGGQIRDAFVQPERMPDWFSEEDLDVLANEFERSGMIGPLSFYRNLDENWDDLAAQAGRPLVVPSLFIGGEYDVATIWGEEALAGAHHHLTQFAGAHILSGTGHWIQQERPEETNRLLRDFIAAI